MVDIDEIWKQRKSITIDKALGKDGIEGVVERAFKEGYSYAMRPNTTLYDYVCELKEKLEQVNGEHNG